MLLTKTDKEFERKFKSALIRHIRSISVLYFAAFFWDTDNADATDSNG
jgi:hypothetical protein